MSDPNFVPFNLSAAQLEKIADLANIDQQGLMLFHTCRHEAESGKGIAKIVEALEKAYERGVKDGGKRVYEAVNTMTWPREYFDSLDRDVLNMLLKTHTQSVKAARDAAWDAAWGAAEIVASDLKDYNKKYPKGAYLFLITLWEMGLYPCGVVNGKFIVYDPSDAPCGKCGK